MGGSWSRYQESTQCCPYGQRYYRCDNGQTLQCSESTRIHFVCYHLFYSPFFRKCRTHPIGIIAFLLLEQSICIARTFCCLLTKTYNCHMGRNSYISHTVGPTTQQCILILNKFRKKSRLIYRGGVRLFVFNQFWYIRAATFSEHTYYY